MHKNATKCNETLSKWCKNKHEASKIIDTLETYQGVMMEDEEEEEENDDNYHHMFPEYGDTTMEDGEEEGGDKRASVELADDLSRVISDAKRDCETEKKRLQFKQMLHDHKKLLYPNCEDGQKKLGSKLKLLRWKAENSVTDSGFNKLSIMMKKLLPRDNELPVSTYEAKKLV
jgi:hypothetical protein